MSSPDPIPEDHTAASRTIPQQILSSNKHWARDIIRLAPDVFQDSASKKQQPHTLWIGCSDSRVPESLVTRTWMGEIFTQRNIANQLPLGDANAYSVVEYAIHFLNVQHVTVVGHSGCGGVEACVTAVQNGQAHALPQCPADHPLNRWLDPLMGLVVSLPPEDRTVQKVVEQNVRQQLDNLRQWAGTDSSGAAKTVWIHGWVYDLASGKLDDLRESSQVTFYLKERKTYVSNISRDLVCFDCHSSGRRIYVDPGAKAGLLSCHYDASAVIGNRESVPESPRRGSTPDQGIIVTNIGRKTLVFENTNSETITIQPGNTKPLLPVDYAMNTLNEQE